MSPPDAKLKQCQRRIRRYRDHNKAIFCLAILLFFVFLLNSPFNYSSPTNSSANCIEIQPFLELFMALIIGDIWKPMLYLPSTFTLLKGQVFNFRMLLPNFIFNKESLNILWTAFAVQSEEYAKRAKQMISHMKIEANDPFEKSEIWQCMYSVYFVLGCALTHLNSWVFTSVCISCEGLTSLLTSLALCRLNDADDAFIRAEQLFDEWKAMPAPPDEALMDTEISLRVAHAKCVFISRDFSIVTHWLDDLFPWLVMSAGCCANASSSRIPLKSLIARSTWRHGDTAHRALSSSPSFTDSERYATSSVASLSFSMCLTFHARASPPSVPRGAEQRRNGESWARAPALPGRLRDRTRLVRLWWLKVMRSAHWILMHASPPVEAASARSYRGAGPELADAQVALAQALTRVGDKESEGALLTSNCCGDWCTLDSSFHTMTLVLQRAQRSTCGKHSSCSTRRATSRTRSCSTQPTSSRASLFVPDDHWCASRRLRHEHPHRAGSGLRSVPSLCRTERTIWRARCPQRRRCSASAPSAWPTRTNCSRLFCSLPADATRRSTTCPKYVMHLCGA